MDADRLCPDAIQLKCHPTCHSRPRALWYNSQWRLLRHLNSSAPRRPWSRNTGNTIAHLDVTVRNKQEKKRNENRRIIYREKYCYWLVNCADSETTHRSDAAVGRCRHDATRSGRNDRLFRCLAFRTFGWMREREAGQQPEQSAASGNGDAKLHIVVHLHEGKFRFPPLRPSFRRHARTVHRIQQDIHSESN